MQIVAPVQHFRMLQNTKILNCPFDWAFSAFALLMGCFHFKKKSMWEAGTVLQDYMTWSLWQSWDFSVLGATLFVYFIQNPLSLSRIRKKSTTKRAVCMVHNTHILLSNKSLWPWFHKTKHSATMLACSAPAPKPHSHAVNSIRDLI